MYKERVYNKDAKCCISVYDFVKKKWEDFKNEKEKEEIINIDDESEQKKIVENLVQIEENESFVFIENSKLTTNDVSAHEVLKLEGKQIYLHWVLIFE